MKNAALEYLANGLNPLVIEWKGKRPLVEWLVYQSRMMTREEVETLFIGQCNVGIITGAISGVVVVDADTQEIAKEFFEKYARTPMVTKTAKGFHLWFKHPGVRVRNRARVAGLPLDVRGDGGYVVVPPSVHESGVVYRKMGDWSMKNLPVFDPQWLAKVEGKRTIDRPGDPDAAWRYISHIRATEGQRDNTAFKVACILTHSPDGYALPYPVALSLLLRWGRECCTPPYCDSNVLARKLDQADRPRVTIEEEPVARIAEITNAGVGKCINCGGEKEGVSATFADGTLKGHLCYAHFRKAIEARTPQEVTIVPSVPIHQEQA
jgi:hypothetical protein